MFTVYTASAGSGKTSRLVVEYLSLALPVPKKFKHILAITFTNNATAEMKSRILDALRNFAFLSYEQLPDSQKATYLAIQSNIQSHASEIPFQFYIKKQAAILLNEILYDYDNFAISTIDAFFQRVLRAFSFELGLNMNYNLEIQLDELHEQTIDLLLNKLSTENKELSKRVLNLVESKMENSGKWKIEKDLTSLLRNIFNEEAFHAIKALGHVNHEQFDAAASAVSKLRKIAKVEYEKAYEEYLKCIQNLQLDINVFQKIISKPEELSSDSFYSKLEKKYKKGVPVEIEQNILEIHKHINQIIEKYNDYKKVIFFGKNISQLALLIDLKHVIDEIKTNDNLFYLSETNGTIYGQVKDEETPFIFEKLGNKYSYFFLDEFQDTSKMQWENILPLIQNSLSGYNDFQEKGKIFLFGDVKQAIYRFRNGDSSLLYMLSQYDFFKELVNPFAQKDIDYKQENLDMNYRSSKAIVDFNNRFFSGLIQNEPFVELEPYYRDVVQLIDESKPNGLVSIRFKNDDDPTDINEYLLHETLKTIHEISKEEISYGDIAVLVSSNNLGSAIGEWLSQNNIPVISSDSLLLSASQEVMVVISTLQYLINPKNKIAQMIMGHFVIRSHPEQQSTLFKSLENEPDIIPFLEQFDIRINPKEFIEYPLYTLINKIIALFKITEKDPYIMMLLDKTDQFIKDSDGSIFLFLDWWSQNKQTLALTTPSNINAVTVTTIHKAKGLAYPIVILPFTEYNNLKTKDYQWIKDEEQISGLPYSWVHLKNGEIPDECQILNETERVYTILDKINKLYVAHTRPKERLYIITQKKDKGNYSKLLDDFISPFLKEEQIDSSFYYYDGNHFYTDKNQIPDSGSTKKSISFSGPNFEISKIFVSDFTFNQQFLAFDTLKARNDEQERGIFVHQFLSDLKIFPENQNDIVHMIQDIPEKYKSYLKQILEMIITDLEFAPYFKNDLEVLNESTIIYTDGSILRPDRVVFMEDQVVVIDYKTGNPSEKHQQQIELYCSKLQEMGYSNVLGKLLYL